MNLYVGAYGLSFKRALTYWGMAVLAVLLAAALWKVWHRHFRWFRVLLSVGAAGWLLLNYANVDALVARYNIGRGLDTGAILSASDGRLGALPALEELLEAQPEETELRQAVETLRDSARWQAAIGRPGRWPLGGGSSRNKNRPGQRLPSGGRPSAQRVAGAEKGEAAAGIYRTRSVVHGDGYQAGGAATVLHPGPGGHLTRSGGADEIKAAVERHILPAVGPQALPAAQSASV